MQALKAHSLKLASKNVHTTRGCQKMPFAPNTPDPLYVKDTRHLIRFARNGSIQRSPTLDKGRAVSAALHTPQLGGHAITGGQKFQSRHHLAPQRKLRTPKLEYEALEISEVRGSFERKVHYSYFGPL